MALGDEDSAADERDEILIKGSGDTPIVTGGTETPHFYERGSFTPTVLGASSAGSYSGIFEGTYISIGHLVFVNIRLSDITEDSAGSGFLHIGNLPADPGNFVQYAQVGRYDNLDIPTGAIDVIAQFRSGSEIRLRYTKDNANIGDISIGDISDGQTSIQFNAMYEIT